jgi:hypothetical protein
MLIQFLNCPKVLNCWRQQRSIPIAAFKKSLVGSRESGVRNLRPGNGTYDSQLTTHDFPLYGLQFHPEVYHSIEGKNTPQLFSEYLRLQPDWTPAHFISDTVETLKSKLAIAK